ncbi:MAG: hypothetical protein JNJ48_07625 [Phycisphaerae bacterium]|nr:hypothetical protein [Phycisphaerae bacterium]
MNVLSIIAMGLGGWLAAAVESPPAGADTPMRLAATWDTRRGLPQDTVTSVAQTPDGYLWLGTFGGLARLDGTSVHIFDRETTPGLPSSAVMNLHVDRSGRLWVSTDRGLVVGDASGWSPVDLPGLERDVWVWSFAERKDGVVLASTSSGAVFECVDGRATALPRPAGVPGRSFFAAADERGRWWLAQQSAVWLWRDGNWSTALPGRQFDAGEYACAPARGGGVWVLAGRELLRIREGRIQTEARLSDTPGGVWKLFEDGHGRVWICTQGQGLVQVLNNGQLRRWDLSDGLASTTTRAVFEDREGSLWVGTAGGGAQQFRTGGFAAFSHGTGPERMQAQGLCVDRGDGVLVATNGHGLVRIDESGVKPVAFPPEGNTLNLVQTVLRDSRGRTWIGSLGQGLGVIDGNTGRRFPPELTGGFDILSLYEDTAGRIWIGGTHRLTVVEPGHSEPALAAAVAGHGAVRWFAEDASGALWMASRDRVMRWESGGLVNGLDASESASEVTFLGADARGVIWVCLAGRGLCRIEGGRLHTGAGERAFRTVSGMIDDGVRAVWLTTAGGVIRVDRAVLAESAGDLPAGSWRLLTTADGLPHVECASGRQPVTARDARGRVWVATLGGAAVIDPARFGGNPAAPTPVIEGMRYRAPVGRGSDGPGGWIEVATENRDESPIQLPAGSRSIEIRFAAPSFISPDRVRFETALGHGVWTDVGSRRTAAYDEPAPGSYRLRVRATNEDGVGGAPPAELSFTVGAFYWQTAWFRGATLVGVVLAAGGGAWWLSRVRHGRAAEHAELLRQRDELVHLSRVAMLGELSGAMAHELNQPLTSILSNAQAAQRYLARDPADVEEVRAILGDIVAEDRRAGELIHRLRLLLHKGEVQRQPADLNELVIDVLRLIRGDLISHSVEARTELAPGLARVPVDPVQVQQVLLNMVMNACEALGPPADGVARVVTIRSEAEPGGGVRVGVVDNGPGIAPELIERVFEPFVTSKARGMGLGLAVCRRIVEAHGGRMWAANYPGGGAGVYFTLPPGQGFQA